MLLTASGTHTHNSSIPLGDRYRQVPLYTNIKGISC